MLVSHTRSSNPATCAVTSASHVAHWQEAGVTSQTGEWVAGASMWAGLSNSCSQRYFKGPGVVRDDRKIRFIVDFCFLMSMSVLLLVYNFAFSRYPLARSQCAPGRNFMKTFCGGFVLVQVSDP